VTPLWPYLDKRGTPAVLSVLLDGHVVGFVPSSEVENVVAGLFVSNFICLYSLEFSSLDVLLIFLCGRFLVIWKWDMFL